MLHFILISLCFHMATLHGKHTIMCFMIKLSSHWSEYICLLLIL